MCCVICVCDLVVRLLINVLFCSCRLLGLDLDFGALLVWICLLICGLCLDC